MYNKYFNKILEIPNYINRKKEYKHQLALVREKKELIDKVQWTKEQTKEYNDFWTKNYGYIPAVEHCKYYEAINGIYNYKYIPRALYARVIEPRMNPSKACWFYEYKNLQSILFSGISEIFVPQNYVSCMDGYYRVNDSLVSLDKAVKSSENLGRVIIKPSFSTSSGKGVRLLNLENGIDTFSGETLKDIFISYKKHFLLQELIVPCDTIRKLSPASVNTFRVFTFIYNGEVHCGPVAFRIGIGNSITDNESSGGFATGVHDDGTLYKKAFSYEVKGALGTLNSFEIHPDTGILLDKYYIGDIEKVKYAACKAHSRIPNLGVLSWDFTLDDNDRVTFVELNTMYCGVDMNMIGTGESLFGDYTEKILKSIYKAKRIGM